MKKENNNILYMKISKFVPDNLVDANELKALK